MWYYCIRKGGGDMGYYVNKELKGAEIENCIQDMRFKKHLEDLYKSVQRSKAHNQKIGISNQGVESTGNPFNKIL